MCVQLSIFSLQDLGDTQCHHAVALESKTFIHWYKVNSQPVKRPKLMANGHHSNHMSHLYSQDKA